MKLTTRSPRRPGRLLDPRAKVAAARLKADAAERAATEAEESAGEIDRCRESCAYFIDTYCIIDDAQGHGDGSGAMPFKLWDAQRDVVAALEEESLLIILKARQLGISWLCCCFELWRCLFRPGQNILLFSQGETEADELLRRVKVVYERLPEWLKAALPPLVGENTSKLAWGNESRVQSMPATPRAGRSLTASSVVMDEAAHMMWADKLYTAAKPTMDGGGQLIILSTANGIGGLFHSIWTKATAALNRFRTVFLPWQARPGRDQPWYDEKVREETDPARVKQEYPANPSEAFLASGRVRFPTEWIERQAANVVRAGVPVAGWPEALRHVPGLTLYSLPDPERSYVIAADVAEGLEHGDYSTAPIIDRDTWEEVGVIHGHWEADTFGAHLATIGHAYGQCPIIVERNNHGHAVLATLKLLGYPRIGLGLDERPGWLSNIATKPQSIDILATALRDGLVVIHTQAALDEMQIYKVLKDGKTGAPEGYHDDRVMSWAIGLAFLQMVPTAAAGAVGGPILPLAPVPEMALPEPPMPHFGGGFVIPGGLD